MRLPVVPTQLEALGVQTWGAQLPALHVSVPEHGVAVQLKPFDAQTSRPVRLPPTQREVPGAQMRV